MQNNTYYGADGCLRRFARVLLLAGFAFAAASAMAAKAIRLATTTSTDNSGLLGFILPKFEAKYGGKVRVVAVGTGAALKLGENGDADVLLVHARKLEDEFMAKGYGSVRKDVMHNDFVLVGPKSDPAGIGGVKDVLAAFRRIKEAKAPFVSRGDKSGTNVMELGYWKGAGIDPREVQYLAIGQGMGQTLTVAGEKQGYTLSDRATYATYRDKTGLQILVEGDPRMYNPYGIITVSPKRYPKNNYQGAMALVDWITSSEGQSTIASFKPKGAQLFFPDAIRK